MLKKEEVDSRLFNEETKNPYPDMMVSVMQGLYENLGKRDFEMIVFR